MKRLFSFLAVLALLFAYWWLVLREPQVTYQDDLGTLAEPPGVSL